MKKVGYILFSLVLSFMLVGNVLAEDVNFELKLSNLNNEIIKGNYADIKLSINSLDNTNIDYCTFVIDTTDTLEFREVQALNSWTISSNNGSGNIVDIRVKNNQNYLSGVSNVLNIRYIVNDKGTVKINSSACYDSNGSVVTSLVNQEGLEIKTVNNTNATLKSLKINNQELNPKFSPNINSYNINNFNANSLSLEYEVSNLEYQDDVVITVNDRIIDDINNIPYEVVEGNKTMLITVTVANTNTYNIFVSKKVNTRFDNTIASITVNDDPLEIVSGKYDYVYIVPDDVANVDIMAELNDSENFMFSSSSNAPATFEFNGKVTAIMNVISKDSQSGVPSATYTVTVVNESNASSLNNPGINNNPDTSDTSMYIMAIILFMSLIGSVFLYQKNINAYK